MRLPTYFLLMATCLAHVASAAAQTVISGDIEEGYSGAVAVSGHVVVGAVLGPLDGRADPSKVLMSLQGEGNTSVCVSGTTRDGVYWTRAQLSVPEGTVTPIRMQPVEGWQYLDRVRKYDQEDFGILTRTGEDCLVNREAPIVPVSYGAEADELSIMINSQRAFAVSASLQTPGGEPVEAVCEQSGGSDIRSTAFNVLCRFDLRNYPASGPHELVINRRLRVGARSDTYALLLD